MNQPPQNLLQVNTPFMNHFPWLISCSALGTIYKATDSKGQLVAVKSVSTSTEKQAKQINSEIQLMKKLNHECIVSLIGAYRKDQYTIWV